MFFCHEYTNCDFFLRMGSPRRREGTKKHEGMQRMFFCHEYTNCDFFLRMGSPRRLEGTKKHEGMQRMFFCHEYTNVGKIIFRQVVLTNQITRKNYSPKTFFKVSETLATGSFLILSSSCAIEIKIPSIALLVTYAVRSGFILLVGDNLL